MSRQIRHFYDFGPFRLDATRRILLRDGEMVALPPKVFDILYVLVENSSEIVEKEELMRRVWPDTIVEEGNLPVNIFALRKALGDDGEQKPYIKTIAKRGYRFVASVTEIRDEKPEAKPQSKQQSGLQSGLQSGASESQALVWRMEQLLEPIAPAAALNKTMQDERRRRLSTPVLTFSLSALGLAALLLLFWITRNAYLTGVSANTQSLAVLPFRMINPESGDDYLGPGISDSIVTTMANIKQLTVRPITASLKYTSAGQDPIEAGRALRVDAVLEGSIRRNGDSLRITAQLVRVSDGARLWEIKSAEDFGSILAVQKSIPEQVVRALALKLTDAEKARLAKRHTESLQACQFSLKGRYLCNQMMAKEVKQGIEYFEQAVKADPNYAAAYAGLAAFRVLAHNPEPMAEKAVKAKAEARRALELDDTLAEAHTALGRAITFIDWDWAGAEKAFKRAIELNPNYTDAHLWYSINLSAQGRHEEAIAELRWAAEIDPFSPKINLSLGAALYLARRYDQAIEQFRKTPLEMGPINHQVFWGLGVCYVQQGRYEEAFAALQKAVNRSGIGPVSQAQLAYAYAKSGNHTEAQKILAELNEPPEGRSEPFVIMAPAYACLGDKEKSFAYFEKAYERRAPRLLYLKVDPLYDCARSDPRFANLVRRMGLTP